jgi:hypothetical protein
MSKSTKAMEANPQYQAMAQQLAVFREGVLQAKAALDAGDLMNVQNVLERIYEIAGDPPTDAYGVEAFDQAFNRICAIHRTRAGYLRSDRVPGIDKKTKLATGGNPFCTNIITQGVRAAEAMNNRAALHQATNKLPGLA